MRYPLCPLVALFPAALAAQQPDWLVSWPVDWNLNPDMPAHVLAASPNGNIMSARPTLGLFSYGSDLFGGLSVERLEPGTGQPLWSCTLLDSVCAESGAVDAEGNVYVAGRFMGALVLCDGSIMSAGPGFLNDDLFLIKFSPEGLILWSRNISSVVSQGASVPVLAIGPDGALWYGTTDFILSRFAKVDEQGNDVEERFIDGGKTLGGLAFDSSGAMYVSGACDQNTFSFGGLNPTLPDDFYLMFLARFRPDGTGHWATFAHDITFQKPAITVDGQAHVTIAGSSFDTLSWGGLHFNGPDWGTATFVAQADSTGQFIWGAESDPAGGSIDGDLNPAARHCIASDGMDNVYVSGTLRGLVDWGAGVVCDGEELTERTQTLAAFSSNGSPLWAATSEPGTPFLHTMNVAALSDGTVYFSAHVNGQFDFEPHSINAGGEQACVIGRISVPMAVAAVSGLPDFTACPSVFQDALRLVPAPGASARVRAFDPSGRLVYDGAYADRLGASWAPGAYTVEVSDAGAHARLRVLKR